jgi:hypothetical protein
MNSPLQIGVFGKWSYALVLLPYYILLVALAWRYRVIFRFWNWWLFMRATALSLLVLGLLFEWMAGVLHVWDFPDDRHLFTIPIPLFGWFTGNRIPICEFLWIAGVVPLFYYLYFWATLVFQDIIYVVDEEHQFYKKEERWVGFFKDTRILVRRKGLKDRRYEHVLHLRRPGIMARTAGKYLNVGET